MIDDAIAELTPVVGVGAACKAVGRPRASHHRRVTRLHGPPAPPASRKGQAQPRALNDGERSEVLAVLRSEQFVDMAPAEVYATLLDEGTYLCSITTMYRLLREQGETGDRRRQATHPPSSPSWWPPAPTRYGAGTSPSRSARPSGPTTCT